MLKMGAANVNQAVLSRLEAMIAGFGQGPALVFLKGFSISYVREMMKQHRPLNLDVRNMERIPLLDVIAQVKSLYRNILRDEQGVFVGLYEELLLMKDSIQDAYDGKLIVIENNLYDSFYRVDYDTKTVVMLQEKALSIQYEHIDNNREHRLFDIVSNYLELGGNSFASFYDMPDNAPVEFLPLVEVTQNTVLIEELPPGVEPLSYHIDNKEDYLCFSMAVEQGEIQSGEIPLVVEYAQDTRDRLAAKLFVWEAIFPEWKVKLYYVSRVKDAPVRPDFYQLLHRFWQTDNFRQIEFYENPDHDANKILITQGTIIESIVGQVELADAGMEYQDVFVTAPTGAGKSLLFQIPAIYLAQNKKFLTIVISPLKALMLDQVRQLQEKGVEGVAYINSDLSHIQKQSIIDNVQAGKVSILYLSPELLLAYDIRSLIGDERNLGLVIVDEAHLVTTWGRDFRIDYWYLGTYLKKLRMNKCDGWHGQFVVAAFTATAVYGGNDDMVFETIDSLNMKNPIKYLGNTRRKNISFYIEHWQTQQAYATERLDITRFRIGDFVKNGKKTIVYAPYRRHIDEIFDSLNEPIKEKVVKFHAGIDADYKKCFEERFRNGKANLMLATKAFGMGVDISDIEVVYHHAPTGNLCDYVQEIGRAGRQENLQGIACMDFNKEQDLSFARVLYGLSGMRQYQLKEVLIKLNRIYQQGKRRNFLINAESFRYLFPGHNDYENKLKNALLLIEKDLQRQFTYPVLIVRPKSLFSKAYAVINDTVSADFLRSQYGEYVQKVEDGGVPKQLQDGRNQYSLYHVGDVYEIDLKMIWEHYFSQMSFPMMKRAFYEKNLFEGTFKETVLPRYKLIYKFAGQDKTEISVDFIKKIEMLRTFFASPAQGRFFTKEFFRKTLKNNGYGEIERRKIVNTVLELYALSPEPDNRDKFLQVRKVKSANGRVGEENEEYRVANLNFHRAFSTILSRFNSLFQTNDFNGELSTYLAVRANDSFMDLAYLLEAFSIASYEVRGGESPEIFIRVNDPYRIAALAAADKRYSNLVLQNIKDRQQRSFQIMNHFFVDLKNDEERWNFIEAYFLGKADLDQVMI